MPTETHVTLVFQLWRNHFNSA
uniref:Uncharacterized protein n=1 Tax=Solanum lycopersicum TaxID=4081 RepID=A0A3Q7EE15_SOLLC